MQFINDDKYLCRLTTLQEETGLVNKDIKFMKIYFQILYNVQKLFRGSKPFIFLNYL